MINYRRFRKSETGSENPESRTPKRFERIYNGLPSRVCLTHCGCVLCKWKSDTMSIIKSACAAVKSAIRTRRPRRNSIIRPRRWLVTRPDTFAADLVLDYARRHGLTTSAAVCVLIRKGLAA